MGFRAGIGQSDFRTLRRDKMDLIDKSALITDLVKDPAQVVLFPRPRRFGKTTNLSMLRYFFETSPEDRTYLFEDLQVWQSAEARAHFQKHPVIWLSLKDVKADSWQEAEAELRKLLQDLLAEHRVLLEGPALGSWEKERFEAMLHGTAPNRTYGSLLSDLSRWLTQYHGEKAVILIDEYDTPIYAAHTRGYSREMLDFMRAFLGGGLKDNINLYKGVVTGILRVARESLFSGLNNLGVYSMLSAKYATAFGFTEAEVADICVRVGQPDLLEGMREMYNGYVADPRGQAVSIYNPWSVLNCAKDPLHTLQPYWRNTASDELLQELMVQRGNALNAEFEHLLAGGEVERSLDDFVVLRDLHSNSDALWSFLWYAGYLKVTRLWLIDGELFAAFRIPNREVAQTYRKVFHGWLSHLDQGTQLQSQLTRALLGGDVTVLEQILTRIMQTNLSYHDPAGRQPEKLYHGFVMGLLVYLEGTYEVRSNPESGYGRVDVLIKPRQAGKPGAVMELKVLQEGETIAGALKGALAQLKTQAYATQLQAAGAAPIHRYAALFDGKRVWLVTPKSWKTRFGPQKVTAQE